MPLLTYDDHPLFPTSAPKGQAHILENTTHEDDVSGPRSLPSKRHQLCDFIATFLHRLREHPDALKDFFDPEVTSFKLLRHYGDAELGGLLPIMIWRRGDEVVVRLNLSQSAEHPWLT